MNHYNNPAILLRYNFCVMIELNFINET